MQKVLSGSIVCTLLLFSVSRCIPSHGCNASLPVFKHGEQIQAALYDTPQTHKAVSPNSLLSLAAFLQRFLKQQNVFSEMTWHCPWSVLAGWSLWRTDSNKVKDMLTQHKNTFNHHHQNRQQAMFQNRAVFERYSGRSASTVHSHPGLRRKQAY